IRTTTGFADSTTDFRLAWFERYSCVLLLATFGSISRPSFLVQPGIFSSNPITAQDALNSFSRPFFRIGSAPSVIAQLTTRALHSRKARSAKPPTSASSPGWGEHIRTVTRRRPRRSDFGVEYFAGPSG